MRRTKVIGVLFMVVGILFAILGTVEYVSSLAEQDDRTYTIAHIVKIEERQTRDPERPIEYTTYVELEVRGEKIVAKLNTYRSSFEVGKQIDVYYFEDDLQTVYEEGSEVFLIIFAAAGALFAVLGAVLTFRINKYSV